MEETCRPAYAHHAKGWKRYTLDPRAHPNASPAPTVAVIEPGGLSLPSLSTHHIAHLAAQNFRVCLLLQVLLKALLCVETETFPWSGATSTTAPLLGTARRGGKEGKGSVARGYKEAEGNKKKGRHSSRGRRQGKRQQKARDSGPDLALEMGETRRLSTRTLGL